MTTNTETTVADNAERITALLSGDQLSRRARTYIQGLVTAHGLEGAAALTPDDRIGLNIFEEDEGSQSLRYGAMGDVDACFCSIATILDAAEAGDEIPIWIEDKSVVVLVTHNGSECFATKEEKGWLETIADTSTDSGQVLVGLDGSCDFDDDIGADGDHRAYWE